MNPADPRWLSDKEYNYIFSKVPRLCIEVVIRSKEGIVFSKRDIPPWKGYWDLPGGMLRYGDSVTKTLHQVVKNETGLRVKIDRIFGVIAYRTTEVPAGHSVSIMYLVHPVGGTLKGSWQAGDVSFFKTIPPKTIPVAAKFLREQKLMK